MVKKDGYLRRLDVKVLIAFDISKGLQGLIVIRHKKDYPQENLAIVDDSGTILDTDEHIRRFVRKGTTLADCSVALQKLFDNI